MAPKLTEDEIDDLLYFARTGESSDFDTLVQELCSRENCGLIELLEVAKDEYSGNGALHMAAANGHNGLLSSTISRLSQPPQNPTLLALINTPNDNGNTPLHWAALNGHLECVKTLVDNGADPTITNKAGHDPVYEAELNDRKEVVDWVLKEGGDGLESGIGGETGEGDGSDEDDADIAVHTTTNSAGQAESSQSGSQLDDTMRKGLEDMGFTEQKS